MLPLNYLQWYSAPQVDTRGAAAKPEVGILRIAIKNVKPGTKTRLDTFGRPDPIGIQIAISKSFDNTEFPGYPDHLDIILKRSLAVHKKCCAIISKAIATPRAEYPQIFTARNKSGRPVDRKKYEPSEKSYDVAEIT